MREDEGGGGRRMRDEGSEGKAKIRYKRSPTGCIDLQNA